MSAHILDEADPGLADALRAMPVPARAKRIVAVLHNAGFPTFLVGGCIRDWLLGKPVHDYDILTTASPLDVYRNFDVVSLVGQRHPLALVSLDGQRLEVSSIRHGAGEKAVACDALTRDFTINALYYDPVTATAYDPCRGQADIARRLLRTIGPASTGLAHDPVRAYRAMRLAAQLTLVADASLTAALTAALAAVHVGGSAELYWRCARELTKMCEKGTLAEGLRWQPREEVLCAFLPAVNGFPVTAQHAQRVVAALAAEPRRDRLAGVLIAALVWPALRSKLADIDAEPHHVHETMEALLRAQGGVLRALIDSHDGWCRNLLMLAASAERFARTSTSPARW